MGLIFCTQRPNQIFKSPLVPSKVDQHSVVCLCVFVSHIKRFGSSKRLEFKIWGGPTCIFPSPPSPHIKGPGGPKLQLVWEVDA